MKNINHFIENVINDQSISQKYADILFDDEAYLHKKFSGNIEESILLRLIKQSEDRVDLQIFLSALSQCLCREEVTVAVFDSLLHYKSRYRKSILIGLAHCHLSYYQLLALNKAGIDEALFQLVDLFFKHSCFSEYDLKMIFLSRKGKIPRDFFESFSEKQQELILSILKKA